MPTESEEVEKHYEFVRAALIADGCSSEHFSSPVQIAVHLAMAADQERPGRLVEDHLLRYRAWFGPWFERMSIICVMSTFKGGPPDLNLRVARALWVNHQRECADVIECALHSLGRQWSSGRLDPPGENTSWIFDGLSDLIVSHPLRNWSRDLLVQAARWVERGWFTPQMSTQLLSAALHQGLHEYLVNSVGLSRDWRTLIDAAAGDRLTERMLRTVADRIIAAGGTRLIPAFLAWEQANPDNPRSADF